MKNLIILLGFVPIEKKNFICIIDADTEKLMERLVTYENYTTPSLLKEVKEKIANINNYKIVNIINGKRFSQKRNKIIDVNPINSVIMKKVCRAYRFKVPRTEEEFLLNEE